MNTRDPYAVARWVVGISAEALRPRSLWLSTANGGLSWWISESPEKPPRTVARPVFVTEVEAKEALKAAEPGGWVSLMRIAQRIEAALADVRW